MSDPSQDPRSQLQQHADSEPPPILGHWRNLNILVLCWLAFLIAVMYGFTRYFS